MRSACGVRVIKAQDFFLSFLTTALEPDELLVEVRLPTWPSGAGWSFQEVSRRHGDFAMVGVGALVRLGADGTIAEARLATRAPRRRPSERAPRNDHWPANHPRQMPMPKPPTRLRSTSIRRTMSMRQPHTADTSPRC